MSLAATGWGPGCATAPREGSSSSQHLRTGGGPAGHFADWKKLTQALSAVGAGTCRAVSQSREDNATALLFAAKCLFTEGSATLSAEARPAITAIAGELAGVTDREFWIAARAGGSGERVSRARAASLVNALIGAGVPPDRLAAIVGAGDGDPTAPPLPGVFAGASVIEIVAAPIPVLALPNRTGR